MTTQALSIPFKVPPELLDRVLGVQSRDAAIEAVDMDAGTVLMRAAPYDIEAEIGHELWESFAPAAFSRAASAPHRVKLWNEHGGPLIGHARDIEDREDGLWINAKFSNTLPAQEARELAHDGTLDQCSVTFRPQRDWIKFRKAMDGIHMRHSRAHLLGVALCAHAAYGDHSAIAMVRGDNEDRTAEEAELAAMREREAARQAAIELMQGLTH